MERESEVLNSVQIKGRLVAAAAAAAAAASLGFAKIAQDHAVEEPPETHDELGIMYEVLLAMAPEEERIHGLTIDTITNWDQVQDIFDSGFVDESTFTEIFMSCAHESAIGLVISKNDFEKFAKDFDIASDLGMDLIGRPSSISEAPPLSIDYTYMEGLRNSSVGGSNAMANRGRMVKAAAAAAALRQEDHLDIDLDNDQDDMSILYSVLIEEADEEARLFGLTLEMIFDWGEVSEMLESGSVTKYQISKLFKSVSEDSVLGRVLSRDNFAKFARLLDETCQGDDEAIEQRDSVTEMLSSSLRNSHVDGRNQMVSATKLELASPQAQQAKGIAALIQSAPQSKGRMVAAAAAASAAAAIGAAKASRALCLNEEKASAPEQDVWSSDMAVLFSVLLAANNQTIGLTQDMILHWVEIQKILEAGIMDQGTVVAVFSDHSVMVEHSTLPLLDQDGFAQFAEHIDGIITGDEKWNHNLPQPPNDTGARNNVRGARTASLFNSLADLEAMSASFEPPQISTSNSQSSSSPPPSAPKRLSLIKEPESNQNGMKRSPLRSSKNSSPQRMKSPQRNTSSRAKSPMRGKSPTPKNKKLSPKDDAIQDEIEAQKLADIEEAKAKLEAERIARGAAAKERMEKRGVSPVRGGKSPPRGTTNHSPVRGKSPTRAVGGGKSPKSNRSPTRNRSADIEAAAQAEKEAEKAKLDADRESRRQAALARMESRKATSPVRGRSPNRSPAKK